MLCYNKCEGIFVHVFQYFIPDHLRYGFTTRSFSSSSSFSQIILILFLFATLTVGCILAFEVFILPRTTKKLRIIFMPFSSRRKTTKRVKTIFMINLFSFFIIIYFLFEKEYCLKRGNCVLVKPLILRYKYVCVKKL